MTPQGAAERSATRRPRAANSAPDYFFIIGAMKAGTTSLYKYLAGHPDLYASPRKEPRVFREAADTDLLRQSFTALFAGRHDERWCFEGSTAYTKYPFVRGVPARIRAVAPDARFIYVVRNPVERTWSQYVHNLAHGRETLAFQAACAARPEYLDISRYALQLQQYYDVFPADRILVQVFEELVRDPAASVRTVCAFLGVDTSYVPATGHVAYNASSTKRAAPGPLRLLASVGAESMVPWQIRHWLRRRGAPLPSKSAELTPDVRRFLVDSLRDDTESLFRLLGRRVESWTDFA